MPRDGTGEAKSALLNQIATQLNDAEDILAAVQSQTPKRQPLSRAAFVAPRTPTERTLAEIWVQLLNVERVGVNDDFFKLGGSSLLATKLISHIYDAFQIELTLKALFQSAPSIAGLAQSIEQHQIGQASMTDIETVFAELDNLSDVAAQEMLIKEELKQDRPREEVIPTRLPTTS
jgi:acyl carrier protein